METNHQPPFTIHQKMKLIIGLGNPSGAYDKTYHNLGFAAADRLAAAYGLKFSKKECDALVAAGFYKGEKIVIAKPQTFMNLSGDSVYQLLRRYKAEVKDLIIVYDDCDLPPAQLRIRPSGSPGTHNGMRSITDVLGREDFARLRIGIGKSETVPLADYVLSLIPLKLRDDFAQATDNAAGVLDAFARGETVGELMRKVN